MGRKSNGKWIAGLAALSMLALVAAVSLRSYPGGTSSSIPSPAGSPPPSGSPRSAADRPKSEEIGVPRAGDHEPREAGVRPRPRAHRPSIDETLRGLQVGNIAYDTPRTLRLNESTRVRLVLSPRATIEELKRSLGGSSGEVSSDSIRISDLMIAQLTGSGLAVRPITPETQAVGEEEETQWQWSVQATDPGQQSLDLVISVVLEVQGKNTPKVLRVYNRSIDVQVALGQRLATFFGNNWQWLWTTAIVPVAGVIYAWRSKLRPS